MAGFNERRARRALSDLTYEQGLVGDKLLREAHQRRQAELGDQADLSQDDSDYLFNQLVLPYAQRKLGDAINQLTYDEAIRVGKEEAMRVNPGMFQDDSWDFGKSITDPLGTINRGLESAKMEHTLGGFIGRETGDKDLGMLFDPAYQDVESNADPALFGDASTGKEGVFDDPAFTAFLNFIPGLGSAISAGGSILNKQADYGNLTEAGYDPSYTKTVAEPSAITAGSYYLGKAKGGNPYGYGTSVGGKAGTAATTAGIGSALQGQTLDQQLRNAAIAGGSTYAGGSLAEATGSTNAGKFGSTATSMGLRELWEDPEKRDAADYYNNLISQYQANRGSYDQPMVDFADFQNVQSLSPDSPLLAMFQQQDQEMPQKRGRVGGSGQFSGENDQIEQSSGSDTYLI